MSELRECPFCGGEAKVEFARPFFMLKKFHNRYVFAGCPNCGVSSMLFLANNKTRSPLINKAHEERAKERAAEAWNRRVGDDLMERRADDGR